MSSFTEQVLLKPARKHNKRITCGPFEYHIGAEDSGEVIEVPKGYEFDGASVPRILRTLVGHPLDTKVVRSALVHDYIYTSMRYLGRARADSIFYEAMIVSGVNKYKALIYYRGVRLGGGFVWNKKIRV